MGSQASVGWAAAGLLATRVWMRTVKDVHPVARREVMASRHLEGKVAVVTGGAGGMGRWICKIFAQQGARVVVADTGADVEGRMGMDPGRVNAGVEEITAAGGTARASVGDVAESAYADLLVGEAIDGYVG